MVPMPLCMYLIVAAGPEEGRMHECSDKAAGSWREASFWRGKCAATFRHPQWVASLSGVIAEQGRRNKQALLSCTRIVILVAVYRFITAAAQAGPHLLASLLSCISLWLVPPMGAPHTMHVSSTTGLPHCIQCHIKKKVWNLASYEQNFESTYISHHVGVAPWTLWNTKYHGNDHKWANILSLVYQEEVLTIKCSSENSSSFWEGVFRHCW